MRTQNQTGDHTSLAGRLVSLANGKSYAIGAAPLTIGREPAADVPVHSAAASRAHAQIRRTPQGYLLVDSSLHGTYVNTERVRDRRILAEGDVVQVAGHSFRFEVRAGAPGPAEPAGEERET
jgi:pSer/pThr/pTyr-binding forkhead associated (FHA) protein